MVKVPLLLLVLASVVSIATCGPFPLTACPPCDVAKCPDITKLTCLWGVGKDSCDCCTVCLAGLGESCGTAPNLVSCGKDMICKGFVVSNRSYKAGQCVVVGSSEPKQRIKRQIPTSVRFPANFLNQPMPRLMRPNVPQQRILLPTGRQRVPVRRLPKQAPRQATPLEQSAIDEISRSLLSPTPVRTKNILANQASKMDQLFRQDQQKELMRLRQAQASLNDIKRTQPATPDQTALFRQLQLLEQLNG